MPNPSWNEKRFSQVPGWSESLKLFIFEAQFSSIPFQFCIPFTSCFLLSRLLSHSLRIMYLPWELPGSWAVHIGFFRFFHTSQTSYIAFVPVIVNFKNWFAVLISGLHYNTKTSRSACKHVFIPFFLCFYAFNYFGLWMMCMFILGAGTRALEYRRAKLQLPVKKKMMCMFIHVVIVAEPLLLSTFLFCSFNF